MCVCVCVFSSTPHKNKHMDSQRRELNRRTSLEKENESLKMRVEQLQNLLITKSDDEHNQQALKSATTTPQKKSMRGNSFNLDIVVNKKLPEGWEEVSELMREGEYAGWLINPSQLNVMEEIGRGSEGTVWKAKWEGATIAVKKIPGGRSAKEARALVRSTEISAKLRHPNVLPLLGAHLNPFADSLLMFPIMCVGTMKSWLYNDQQQGGGGIGALFSKSSHSNKSKAHEYKKRLKAAWDVAKGMSYLEDMSIMHRDLKPSNIFMKSSEKGCAVIADFGLSRYSSVKDNNTTTPTICTGTFIYMAPEVIIGAWYDCKCDVYSFGVLLNELLGRVAPYAGLYYSPQQIAQAVVEQNMRPKLFIPPSEKNSTELMRLAKLAENCWHKDPDRRPTFAEILRELDESLPALEVTQSPDSFPASDCDGDCGDNDDADESRSHSRRGSQEPRQPTTLLGSINKVLEAFF